MAENKNINFVRQLLSERFECFRKSLNMLIRTVSNHDAESKVNACRAALEDLRRLKDVVSTAHRPSWMKALESKFQWYLKAHNQPDASPQLLEVIIAQFAGATTHEWDLDSPSATQPIDFDSIYRHCYEESKMPALFEALVQSLQQVVDSKKVDRVSAIDALEKVIATSARTSVARISRYTEPWTSP